MNVKQLPAFIYVKRLRSGVVLNKDTEPIAYAEDSADLSWLFSWITDYDKHRLKWKLTRSALQGEILKRRRIFAAQSSKTFKAPSKPYAVIPASTPIGDRNRFMQ